MSGSVSITGSLAAKVGIANAKAGVAVSKTCADIEAGAKRRSRVDTGQMRNGWETRLRGLLEGEVVNNVQHALYNEYGTVNMEAQPMLHPAVEEARAPFLAAMREAYS